MDSRLEDLQERWDFLYRERLPRLAKAKDPVQSRWPVYLDHCFARIVLDNAVGVDRPWTEVVKQPAVRNMTPEQVKAAIDLAEKIADGQADLDSLNDASLDLRGKKKRKADERPKQSSPVKKQRNGTVSSYFHSSPQKPNQASTLEPGTLDKTETSDTKQSVGNAEDDDMEEELKRIETSNLTTSRKQALTLLCQIPRGRYSTYQAMADYITKTSHKSCARAVGSAMRNNPFAPGVPCHRVLASDGSLGGFCGYWGENGKFANKKHELLHQEGVRFDSKGRVKGPPFRDFTA